jgi:hypothetical protein
VRNPPGGVRWAAIATGAAVALLVVLAPWYALDDYVPNGWDATWWARLAALLAIANVALLRLRAGPPRLPVTVAGTIVALVAVRVAFPPDFGFDFDGLTVPVERRAGCWAALAAAALHLGAVLWLDRSGPAVTAASGP